MDALHLDKVHFVGLSTGGIIGQGLGIRHGERLHSLALCNSWPLSTQLFKRRAALRQAAIEVGGMALAWEETKQLWLTDDFVEEKGNEYCRLRAIFMATSVDSYLGGTSALSEFSHLDDLHLIQTPTLVLGGALDQFAW